MLKRFPERNKKQTSAIIKQTDTPIAPDSQINIVNVIFRVSILGCKEQVFCI